MADVGELGVGVVGKASVVPAPSAVTGVQMGEEVVEMAAVERKLTSYS